MKTLISPVLVLKLAFGDGERLSPEAVAADDIAAAEQRYLVPAIGRALHEKLLAGAYRDFTADYLAAPAALFTRLLIQPRLDIRTGQCGATAPRSPNVQPADQAARRRLQRSLLSQARTLLRRATDHLDEHPAEFPEYTSENNIGKRCSIDGNLVLTH